MSSVPKRPRASVPVPDIGGNLHASQRLYVRLQEDRTGFEALSRLLKERAGIEMPTNEKNLCLMATRLSPLLRARGIADYAGYLALVRSDEPAARREFISVMTTHTTQFFREPQHFEVLARQLPAMLARKQRAHQRELRVWCAAASTGQEPYTILMTLLDAHPELAHWDLKMLATDIDVAALGQASRGVYRESELASLPAEQRGRYVVPIAGRAGEAKINPELTRRIRFAPFNLVEPRYPFQYPFDIVFCRNVLIYFDPPTAAAVVHRLAESLGPEGLLFLGHSESGAMKSPLLKSIAPAAFMRGPKAGRGGGQE